MPGRLQLHQIFIQHAASCVKNNTDIQMIMSILRFLRRWSRRSSRCTWRRWSPFPPVRQSRCISLACRQKTCHTWNKRQPSALGLRYHNQNCPQSRLHRLRFDPWSWPMTLTFNPRRAMVMIHAHAKDQGQRVLGSKIEWKQTDGRPDGWMDGWNLSRNSVGNKL